MRAEDDVEVAREDVPVVRVRGALKEGGEDGAEGGASVATEGAGEDAVYVLGQCYPGLGRCGL